MQLPGELRSLLEILGYTWPEGDEMKMFEMGGAWVSFSGDINGIVAEANAGAQQVWTMNKGPNAEAFQKWWTKEDSPADSLSDGATAAVLTGTGLIICGAIILALKIAVIVQLIVLAIQIAQAIATAAVTFGASLAEIPIFQQIAKTIVGNLVTEAVFKLLEG